MEYEGVSQETDCLSRSDDRAHTGLQAQSLPPRPACSGLRGRAWHGRVLGGSQMTRLQFLNLPFSGSHFVHL